MSTPDMRELHTLLADLIDRAGRLNQIEQFTNGCVAGTRTTGAPSWQLRLGCHDYKLEIHDRSPEGEAVLDALRAYVEDQREAVWSEYVGTFGSVVLPELEADE